MTSTINKNIELRYIEAVETENLRNKLYDTLSDLQAAGVTSGFEYNELLKKIAELDGDGDY